jgi:hypothetical protein
MYPRSAALLIAQSPLLAALVKRKDSMHCMLCEAASSAAPLHHLLH